MLQAPPLTFRMADVASSVRHLCSDKPFVQVGIAFHTALVETVFNQLKHLLHIEHTRHRSPTNFAVSLVAGRIAYCHQPDKPSIYRRGTATTHHGYPELTLNYDNRWTLSALSFRQTDAQAGRYSVHCLVSFRPSHCSQREKPSIRMAFQIRTFSVIMGWSARGPQCLSP